MLIPVLIDQVKPPLGFGLIHAASLIEWDGGQSSEASRSWPPTSPA